MAKYPFRLKVNNPEVQKILIRLEKDRVCNIDKNISKSLGWKIKPIRRDVRITRDLSFDNTTYIHLEPFIKIKKSKKKNTYIFDRII